MASSSSSATVAGMAPGETRADLRILGASHPSLTVLATVGDESPVPPAAKVYGFKKFPVCNGLSVAYIRSSHPSVSLYSVVSLLVSWDLSF